jgi:cold-inducible RNA-binding protein
VFIRNLPWKVREEELRAWLDELGYDVEKVQVLTEPDSGRSRGFGFITFPTEEAAAEALRPAQDGGLEGEILEGRVVYVEEAKDKEQVRGRDDRRGGGGGRGGRGGRGRRESRRDEWE